MGTSHQGEMLPGTQVGLLRKTCSRSAVEVGVRASWALPYGSTLGQAGGAGGGWRPLEGLGPVSSASCPSRVSLLACERETAVGETRLTHPFPCLPHPVPGEGPVQGT